MDDYRFKMLLLHSIRKVCQFNLQQIETPTTTGVDAFRAILDDVETVLHIEDMIAWECDDYYPPDID